MAKLADTRVLTYCDLIDASQWEHFFFRNHTRGKAPLAMRP